MHTFIFCIVCLSLVLNAHSYNLHSNFSGQSFFDGWTFFTAGDPTGGTVDYVSEQVARQKGYIQNIGSQVYIGCDKTSVVPSSARGRQSVRIVTKESYNSGLFIMDLTHMPSGCGTWPAWWLVGPNWPTHGEIDIIEGVDTNTVVGTTLHTSDGCSMQSENPSLFSGKWALGSNNKPATNCFVKAAGQYNNQGCGIVGPQGSYGVPFNQANGGVYATEWTAQHIRTWFWPRGRVPADVQSRNPDPTRWGTPYAYFQLGSQCPSSHFNAQQMVINLTFCGDDAGGAHWSQMCSSDGTSCPNFVRNHPQQFAEAHWTINYVAVYQ